MKSTAGSLYARAYVSATSKLRGLFIRIRLYASKRKNSEFAKYVWFVTFMKDQRELWVFLAYALQLLIAHIYTMGIGSTQTNDWINKFGA